VKSSPISHRNFVASYCPFIHFLCGRKSSDQKFERQQLQGGRHPNSNRNILRVGGAEIPSTFDRGLFRSDNNKTASLSPTKIQVFCQRSKGVATMVYHVPQHRARLLSCRSIESTSGGRCYHITYVGREGPRCTWRCSS
jgi:hypothetical protein